MNTRIPPVTLRPLLAIGLAGGLLSSVASADVVYRETFGNDTAGGISYSSLGWQIFNTATATNQSNATTGNAISSGVGPVTDLPNLGQEQTSLSETNGFAFFSGGRALAFTSEYNGALPLTTATITGASFYNGNSAAMTYRLALRVNDGVAESWFVSTAQNGTTVANAAAFASDGVQLIFDDFSTASWFPLNFEPGVALAVINPNDPIFLPTGAITAFGFYSFTSSGTPNGRVDSFEIAAIPEPSAFAALAGLGVLALAATRRRR